MSTSATAALFLWPIVAAVLYFNLPVARATVWNFLGAQMFLPIAAVKYEMIPPIDKTTVPTFCAVIAALVGPRRRTGPNSGSGWTELLLLMYLAAPIFSALSNSDTMAFGERVLPGVGLYDGLSGFESAIIALVPFYLGRKLLRTQEGGQQVLRDLALAGAIYSIFMLVEIRLSPQFHYWVYGYYSSDFAQATRGDAYRPMVFMGNGLLATFFLMSACVAAAALQRARVEIFRLPPPALTGYLAVVLVWCRSLGTTIYGAVGVPLVLWASPRNCARAAVVLALLSLCYPLLRANGLIPMDAIVEAGNLASSDRAGSVRFRFINEDKLLAHAAQRPLFGWGRFGRSRVYDEEGNDLSVTDGRWIITMGQFGLFGFLAEFGLLALGVLRAYSVLKLTRGPNEAVHLASLALIVALNLVDLLPNATLTPLTFLFAGTLIGQAEQIRVAARRSRSLTRTGLVPSS